LNYSAGFGQIGVGKVAEVVGDKALWALSDSIGTLALEFKTGDEFFL